MKIWLIKTGEPLTCDPGNPRLLRMGIIADEAASRGHDVTFWTSTFDHNRKKQRSTRDTVLKVLDNYIIKMLYSPGYLSNVSIRRLIDHYLLARKFKKCSANMNPPDIILAAMPTIDFSLAATRYGRKANIPVVLDLRDMWPDIFVEVLPQWLKPLGKLALTPMYTNLRRACRDATALFGITREFLGWGLNYAGRKRNDFDGVFYHGYSPVQPDENEIAKAQEFWEQHGISRNNSEFIACFFGYFGRQFEIQTVLDAAKKLKDSRPDIKFVLCGDGDNLEYYRVMAADLDNVVLPGFVGQPAIWTLMKMSSVGLAPYKNTPSFIASLPNKVGEYLSAGLPIISGLKGELEEFLVNNNCGITYPNAGSDELAGILSDLYGNKHELIKLGDNSRKVFKENFLSNIIYGNMIDKLECISRHWSDSNN